MNYSTKKSMHHQQLHRPAAGPCLHLKTGEQSLPVVEDLVKLGQVGFLGVQKRSSLDLAETNKIESAERTPQRYTRCTLVFYWYGFIRVSPPKLRTHAIGCCVFI